MSGTACQRWRFPFREMRNMKQVQDTEALLVLKRKRGWLHGHEAKQLDALLSRAIEPQPDEPPEAA